jgi:hypothetical protein
MTPKTALLLTAALIAIYLDTDHLVTILAITALLTR